MQITLNQEEVINALQAHVDIIVNVAGDVNITVNEDGTALVLIGEESHGDTPPVVERQKRTRGPNKRSPQEAKHRPVNQEPETPTTVGGQNESSTPEAKEAEQGEQTEPTEQLKEEATEQVEEASQEAEVQEEVQEEKVAEQPASSPKPSLFAGLKR